MGEPVLVGRNDQWHFRHLGRAYFVQVVNAAKARKFWPIDSIATGRQGQPYATGVHGRTIRPNWQVKARDGRFLRSLNGTLSEARFDEAHLHTWPYTMIASEFGLRQE